MSMQSVGFDVRRATAEDLETILQYLEDDRARSELETGGSFHHNANVLQDLFQKGIVLVVGAASELRIEGFLAGDPQSDDVTLMEVWSKHRGKGRGAALLSAFEIEAKQAGAFGLVADCISDKAVRFFEKMGYVPSLIPGRGKRRRIKAFVDGSELASDLNAVALGVELVKDDTWTEHPPMLHGYAAITNNELILERDFVAEQIPSQVILRLSVNGLVIYENYLSIATRFGVEISSSFVRLRRLDIQAIKNLELHEDPNVKSNRESLL